MNNHIFDRVETLAGDFAATLAAIHKANKEQGEIITAARARIDADKMRVEARRTELRAAVKDNGRSVTVRSLAQTELDGLSETEFKPTAAEQAAFGDATARAEQAIADLRRTRDELRTALAAASAELKGIRADTIGKTDTLIKVAGTNAPMPPAKMTEPTTAVSAEEDAIEPAEAEGFVKIHLPWNGQDDNAVTAVQLPDGSVVPLAGHENDDLLVYQPLLQPENHEPNEDDELNDDSE